MALRPPPGRQTASECSSATALTSVVAPPPRITRFHAAGATKIGFIGLGNMGAHMARNLLKANLPVTVLDVNANAVDALKKAGATAASTSWRAGVGRSGP